MLLDKPQIDEKSLFSKKMVGICVCLFAIAFGVRFLVWQNNKITMEGVQYVVTQMYKNDAKTLLAGNLREFLAGPNPPSDATILEHPPGYSLFIALVYGVFGENEVFRIIQILINSFASILVFSIAFRLFNLRTAVIAGLFIAIAPQFAYYSGIILPDELSVMPILLAVYFLIRAVSDKKLKMAVLCGVSLGLSCWLRSNALLLPIFFAAATLVLLPKEVGIRFALILIASFLVSISPITVRNYVVFHSFIPLSVGIGTTFVEGLGEYDTDGRLGLPSTDEGIMAMDSLRAGRPDYYGNLYDPDGILRERERVNIGLGVVRANPWWYFKAILHRGITTFRMERVPVIAAERDEKDTTSWIFYYLNVPLKLFQKVFITAVFLPLFLIGVILLLSQREQRIKLAILAVVPLYFISVQSLIHTEYRYVLATPHILMVIAAVSLSFLVGKIAGLRSQRSDA